MLRSPPSSTPPDSAPAARPFTPKTVQWLRWGYKILYPSTWAHDGELTVGQIAERLGVSDGTIYYWISAGHLAARRGPGNRL